MVQTRSLVPAASSFPASLDTITASAAALPLGSGLDVALDGPMFGAYQGSHPWQAEVYRHLIICSEARQAVNILARSLGRAKIIGNTPAAQAALDSIFAGPMKVKDYLERGGAHITAGGEFYLVGRRVTAAERLAYPGMEGQVIWEVRQPSEISNEGDRVTINAGLPQAIVLDTKSKATVHRVWQPDLTDQNLPDSPLRALLPVLNEIEAGTNRIWAQMTSRLTGNGILSVPEDWEAPALPGQPANPANRKTSLMRTIAAVASQAMLDPRSPAARLPITVTKPQGSTDTIEWHTFWSELDAETVSNRKEAIQRFALGMDLPPEQILGLGGQAQGQHTGSNRWNVWAIEESTITLYVEPILKVLLAPLERLVKIITGDDSDGVEYDIKELRLKPDRSKEAIELYNLGLVGGDTVRRENGFDESDAPTPQEVKEFIARRIAIGGAPVPEQLAWAANFLGLAVPAPLNEIESGGGQNPATQVSDEQAQRQLDQHERRSDRVLTASATSTPHLDVGLLTACEAVVLRVLERVGSKLIRDHSTRERPVMGLDPTQAHVALTASGTDWTLMLAGPNAFGMALLASTPQPGELLDHLTEFAESLVHARKPYTREAMTASLLSAIENGDLYV